MFNDDRSHFCLEEPLYSPILQKSTNHILWPITIYFFLMNHVMRAYKKKRHSLPVIILFARNHKSPSAAGTAGKYIKQTQNYNESRKRNMLNVFFWGTRMNNVLLLIKFIK